MAFFVSFMLRLFPSGMELCRTSSHRGRAASSGPLPMEKSQEWSDQGEEGLDHPSDKSAGEQQAGSWKPCPGKMLTLTHLKFTFWATLKSKCLAWHVRKISKVENPLLFLQSLYCSSGRKLSGENQHLFCSHTVHVQIYYLYHLI